VYPLAQHDPATAANWVELIDNRDRRISASMNLAHQWLQQDPVAARNWITGTDLPDQFKQQLLNSPAGR